jgi:vancomycin resistance protein YoaR
MKQGIFKSAIIFVLTGVIAFFAVSCKNTLTNSDLIAEGVTVMGKEIGSLTREEAQKRIETIAKTMPESMELQFKYEDVEFNVSTLQIDLKLDAEKTLENAYKIGRGKDNKENKSQIKKAKKQGMEVGVELIYDKDKFLLVCADYLGSKITDPTPMNVETGKDCLIVTNAIEGKIVDIEKADRDIQKELSDFEVQDKIILKLKKHTPDNLTFEEFKKQYKKEAKDAVYTKKDGKHNIVSEVIGVDFDDDEAKKIFKENQNSKEPYKIPAKITYPKVTAKMLEDKYVNNIIATYSTSYAGSSSGRIANIVLAAQKINGYVINPGKRFSYNQVVGPRTSAAGFKMAHVYVGTKVVDGIGGGICQVSSTLYNAVVMADLKTVSRTNHSIPVSYVPLGRDATVSYGTIDYVFENNKPYPVSIKATTSGSTLTISIVGTSDVDYTVDFVTSYISSVPYSTVTEEDPSMNEGETKVLENGSNGSVYESYRVYKKDGVEYKRTFESKSRYQSVSKRVAVGVKKEETPEETEEPKQVPEENQIPPESTEVSGDITKNEENATENTEEAENIEEVQATDTSIVE